MLQQSNTKVQPSSIRYTQGTMNFDLTEFEQEVIRDWRALKSQEVLILTKAKEKSILEGMMETRKRKEISKIPKSRMYSK